MKTLRNTAILLFIVYTGVGIANAQTAKKDKKTAKEATIKSNVDAKNYTFIATYMLPQRGDGKSLTSEYDFKVTKDSLISFLPYYGRAYFVVPYNGADGGIKFTSTKFSYVAKDKKKGGWEITIIPSDVRNLNRLIFNISPDGYASLSVTSNNRDFITFNGYLK